MINKLWPLSQLGNVSSLQGPGNIFLKCNQGRYLQTPCFLGGDGSDFTFNGCQAPNGKTPLLEWQLPPCPPPGSVESETSLCLCTPSGGGLSCMLHSGFMPIQRHSCFPFLLFWRGVVGWEILFLIILPQHTS